jgi:hypothetical protein
MSQTFDDYVAMFPESTRRRGGKASDFAGRSDPGAWRSNSWWLKGTNSQNLHCASPGTFADPSHPRGFRRISVSGVVAAIIGRDEVREERLAKALVRTHTHLRTRNNGSHSRHVFDGRPRHEPTGTPAFLSFPTLLRLLRTLCRGKDTSHKASENARRHFMVARLGDCVWAIALWSGMFQCGRELGGA